MPKGYNPYSQNVAPRGGVASNTDPQWNPDPMTKAEVAQGWATNPLEGLAGGFGARGQAEKAAMAARPTWFGGSSGGADYYRDRYESGEMAAAQGLIGQGQAQSQGARALSQRDTTAVGGQLGTLAGQQGQLAQRSEAGFGQAVDQYGQSRGQTLQAAGRLTDMANRAPQEYMKTDQNAFQAQQDQATRGALSIGAAGGASGVRAALAGSQDANAAAAQQAQMVRANEFNALLGNRQQATTQAAGLYGDIGARDQGMANTFSGRQEQATGQQAQLIGAQGDLALGQGQLGVTAGGQTTNAGTALTGTYVGAQTNVNKAQLEADVAYEQQRQESAKEKEKKRRPFAKVLGGFLGK